MGSCAYDGVSDSRFRIAIGGESSPFFTLGALDCSGVWRPGWGAEIWRRCGDMREMGTKERAGGALGDATDAGSKQERRVESSLDHDEQEFVVGRNDRDHDVTSPRRLTPIPRQLPQSMKLGQTLIASA
jgi:hypothetical protein